MNLDPRALAALTKVEAPMLTWVTVHGNLCLALRHPENRGQSRQLCINMVRQLSEMIVAAGVMTQQEMDEANRLEAQHGSQVG